MLMKRPEKEQHRMKSSINWAEVAAVACEKIDSALSDIPVIFEEVYYNPGPKFDYHTKSGTFINGLFSSTINLSDTDVALSSDEFIDKYIIRATEEIAAQINRHPANKPGSVFSTVGLEIPGGLAVGERVDGSRVSVRVAVAYDIVTNQMVLRVDVLGGFSAPESAEVAACQ